MSRRFILLPAFGLVLLALPALAADTGPSPVVLEGQVFDAAGEGVAGLPVRVLMSRRVITLKTLSLDDQHAEGPSTLTDARGFFRIELQPRADYDFYYLRFYDRTRFDAVRHALPEDEDITDRVRAGRSVIVQRRLADAPNWPQVVREIERVGGADTPRGRILRALGLPDAVVTLEDGRSEWRYDRAGVRYVLDDGEVVERIAQGASDSATRAP